MANTTGPQLPDFLRPAAPAGGNVRNLHLTRRGKVRRSQLLAPSGRRPWYRRPLLGCAKPTDLLLLLLLLTTAAYVTHDLRSTGRLTDAPAAAPAAKPKAVSSNDAPTTATTYANGLDTGP